MSICTNENEVSFGGPFTPPETSYLCPACECELDDFDGSRLVCHMPDCKLYEFTMTPDQAVKTVKEFDR